LDHLSIQPTTIDTPDFVYKKFRFVYAHGNGQIIARSGYPIRTAAGVLTNTGPHSWELVTDDDGVWTIDRTRGCACGGQPIIPKTTTAAP
jgi:hypothetical protein